MQLPARTHTYAADRRHDPSARIIIENHVSLLRKACRYVFRWIMTSCTANLCRFSPRIKTMLIQKATEKAFRKARLWRNEAVMIYKEGCADEACLRTVLAPSKNGFGLVAWRRRADIRVASLAVIRETRDRGLRHWYIGWTVMIPWSSWITSAYRGRLPPFPTSRGGIDMHVTFMACKGQTSSGVCDTLDA